MDSFKKYLKRHPKLFYTWVVFDFLFIFLPQWIDSVWDLAEKIHGGNIAMPHPDIVRLYAITVPIGLIMFVIAIWAVRSKSAIELSEITNVEAKNLTPTLTAMHRRLVEIQHEKALHTRVSYNQIEKASPYLLDKLGLVPLRDQPKFWLKVKRRVQRNLPQPHFNRPFSFSERRKFKQEIESKAISVGLQVQKELMDSKEWTIEDGLRACDWMDVRDWGVKKMRDNDLQWMTLWESISDYLTKDKILRNSINKHVDMSYIYNDMCLMRYYSDKFRKPSFLEELCTSVADAPISPEKAEIFLSEILNQIEKRLIVLNYNI